MEQCECSYRRRLDNFRQDIGWLDHFRGSRQRHRGSVGIIQQQISQIIFSPCSIDFDAVAANRVKTAFCPVPGAQIGDHVIVTNQDLALGLVTQSATVNGTECKNSSYQSQYQCSRPSQLNLGTNNIQVMRRCATNHTITYAVAKN